ncbi:TetR/AcrR family transcriptional regulator [Nocardia cyriacigeorgica]|jgi:AcrR family transcriptional regulator|uniref:TetR/AcrR family transcriptional regulator n=2 Tax=Nocardia cyriacigeorgica TaxID=135487 RepID=UPI0005611CE9|nr:TetR/AcrR family transcriptional regulator [Nocardia cyriacigeorgica]AVH24073.1 TetR/AcrR family transcriptional regulator [Nocardia cyriacigeorgica]MBF6326171.1 TetR/AcrR family transcriptional regulator [Nocardia cyriacigeorgica]MBF6499139.1 TetR/AcrR family transcriptional regulator [Nocardia cyriacigeorgica]PPJ08937.1 TetR/AcrR family transcriptional regulator [Nocardia cyriacigeorgica]TLF59832.1 TetR/AcrR family transcriptional regulator [Nocardia cyriacigeorgica]
MWRATRGVEFSDAQRRILLAAERLFAERGVSHVSMREISAAAGQRNNSAVQYHFQNKHALLRALYDLRMVPLNMRRNELLDLCAEHTVHSSVDAFIRPLGEAVVVSGGANAYARFLNRHLTEMRRQIEDFGDDHVSGAFRVYRLLDDLLAELPEAERTERFHQMNRIVTSVLADLEERLELGETDSRGARRAVETLISGVATAVSSPC